MAPLSTFAGRKFILRLFFMHPIYLIIFRKVEECINPLFDFAEDSYMTNSKVYHSCADVEMRLNFIKRIAFTARNELLTKIDNYETLKRF
jgi:hypothetical protein